MKNRIVIFVVFVCCLWTMPGIVRAQLSVHQFDQLMKKIDDVLWYEKVGDIAHVDKVILCGPPRWKESNPTSMSAGNELKFRAYIFIPKSVKENKKYPLIVFPHSGVHADMDTYYAHIIRELIAQEYIVVAADYRGSTGEYRIALILQPYQTFPCAAPAFFCVPYFSENRNQTKDTAP